MVGLMPVLAPTPVSDASILALTAWVLEGTSNDDDGEASGGLLLH